MRRSLRVVFALLICLASTLGLSANARANVDGKPLSAVLPQTLSVEVTGNPASAAVLKDVIEGAIRTKLVTAENSHVVFSIPPLSDLGTGITRAFEIKTRVSAAESLVATGTVNVVIHNLGLERSKDDVLWYSNNPESVVRPGALFSSALSLGSSARLLYHHINASQQGMYIRVQAINDSDTPAKLLLIPGDSKPDRNPVSAGLHAGDQYLKAWTTGSGEVVTIPPHQTLPISLRRVLPGETMSGLCSLKLVAGPKQILVRDDAWPLFQLDKNWEAAVWSPTPWRVVGTVPMNEYDRAPYEPSQHVYPDPYLDSTLNYQVGGRFGRFRIGPKPIASQGDQQRLDGNFGVLYTLHIAISNPTAAPADVELEFEASAGYSGALFVLSHPIKDVEYALAHGTYSLTPPLVPKGESRIARFHLLPGAHQRFDVTTLPLSGGSYPATITLRPVQSQS